jgi:teichuronic acid exporter
MSLKQKAIHGLTWSFIDSFTGQGIQFVIGIVLARLLSPREFGLIGMITIFISISQSFIDSGFQQALIRKKSCTQADYSTVFYFNIAVGLFFYFLLFFSAISISKFYHEPQLQSIIRILGLSLIINSFTIIQITSLTKQINFKLQARISIISAVFSGTLSISLALSGFGVWSLVGLTLSKYFVNSFFLWLWNKWRPLWIFSKESFKDLFSFGSKLLLSGLIDTAYRNIYYLVIGKYFSAVELGYYTRADQFKALPAQNLQGIIGRVSYPILSSIQDDKVQLKQAYKKLIKSTMLITFVLLLGMAAVAKPMILILIGEKWLPCVVYLQMLCFVGMFFPLHALNLNMLQVQGRSDLFLRLEIIKKLLAVPTIIIGVIWGIKILILGMLVVSIVSYYINSYWSGRFIGYSFVEQVKDIFPSFLLGAVMSGIVFFEGQLLHIANIPLFILQLFTGIIIIIGFSEWFHLTDYLYLKEIVKEKINFNKNHFYGQTG